MDRLIISTSAIAIATDFLMNNLNSGSSKGLFLPDGSGDPVLEFGEPFIAAAEVPENRLVNVQGSTAARSSVFLLFSFRGQGKEGISDLSKAFRVTVR